MLTVHQLGLQYRCFVVGKRPFCLWDTDIQKRTLEFLEGVAPSYFAYVAEVHLQNIDFGDESRSERSQHAALAVRAAYSQALETLFALIGATVQAPYCVPAWIDLYRMSELRDIVDRIHHSKPLMSTLRAKFVTWPSVSEAVFMYLALEDKAKESEIKSGFARLWSRFAKDFLNEQANEEYNCIKHGLRVRPGGFRLAIGIERGAGEKNLQLLGMSKFGSRYIKSAPIVEKGSHVQVLQYHRNWNPEDMCWGLHLISMSISNIVSALKALNGIPADQVQFTWPTDLSAFDEPWKRSTHMGVTAMRGFDIVIHPESIVVFPKAAILEKYNSGQDAGIVHIRFSDRDEAAKGEQAPNGTGPG